MTLKAYHIGIDYKEPDQYSYKAVEVRTKTDNDILLVNRFASCDPEKDWKDALYWVFERSDFMCCVMSSSCDHFVMDGDQFKWSVDDSNGMEMIVRR